MVAALREIVVDCEDPACLAAFWSQALGWEVQNHTSGALWMSASGTSSAGVLLVFVPARERGAGRNRFRPVVSPTAGDRAQEVARLVALGARAVPGERHGGSWSILTDPEGNEFTVVDPAGGGS
ncbi:MAG: VOC family protein [Acidimicrobiales bacterium]